MTPADELRAAAKVLREMAAKATPGPWRRHDTHLDAGSHTATVLAGDRNETRLIAWLPTFEVEPWGQKRNVWNDSQWIALMSPAVAEPLAAWLDNTARYIGFEAGAVSGPEAGQRFFEDKYRHALAFARAITKAAGQ